MAVFSVDSDAVLATTAAVRGTIDRLEAETHAMLNQLTLATLVSMLFGELVPKNAALARPMRAALATAGRQYAEAEQATLSMFR